MELLSAAFANNPILVEIDQAQCGSFRHVVVNHGNGKETFHYRFG